MLAAVLCSFVLFPAAAISAGLSKDRVVAVIPLDSPPTYFRDKQSGKAAGFAVDVMDVVAAKAGLQVEYVFQDGWSEIIEKIKSGAADLAPGMGISKEREQDLGFSSPIDAFPISFFVRSEHSGIDAVSGTHSVGVIRGSIAFERLKGRADLHLVIYEEFGQGLFDLLAGRIEAFACPAPTLWQLARESGIEERIKVVDKSIAEIARAIAVRKDNTALLERLNKPIEGLVGTPAYQNIYVKWYGHPTPYWTPVRIAAGSAACLVAIVMIMAGWRYLSVMRLNRDLAKTESELKRAKEEWERTFDALADPVMILDTNYRIVKANRAMAVALGVTPVDAIGMTCYKSVHGTEAPPEYCPNARLLADCQVHSREICEPRLGGHYLISVSPLHAADGALVGSIHAARDITLLKKAEEMSRQYSHDLERLLAVSRDMTMTTDLRSLYRSFVSTARDVLALDFSTLLLLSEDKKSLILQDCLGFPESMIGRFTLVEGQGLATIVVKSKKPETVADFACETRFEVPSLVWEKNIQSAVAVPMMMKDDIIGVLVGHTLERREFSPKDLSLYQQIGNQAAVAIRNATSTGLLRKSEKYVRDVTAALSEGVYVLNARGETTFMNPEAEALLGWSESDLINKNIHDVVHCRRADGTPLLFEDCEMRKVIVSGRRFHSTDEVFIRKDGAVFPVSVFSTPLLEHGAITASVTAFRDISAIKQIEQERERLIADLQKALAEIKTLHGILPICSFCKKIRNDKGAWTHLESYISEHTDALFSHGLCQECAKQHYPEVFNGNEKP
jgi:PAS domain S-box-containing protein